MAGGLPGMHDPQVRSTRPCLGHGDGEGLGGKVGPVDPDHDEAMVDERVPRRRDGDHRCVRVGGQRRRRGPGEQVLRLRAVPAHDDAGGVCGLDQESRVAWPGADHGVEVGVGVAELSRLALGLLEDACGHLVQGRVGQQRRHRRQWHELLLDMDDPQPRRPPGCLLDREVQCPQPVLGAVDPDEDHRSCVGFLLTLVQPASPARTAGWNKAGAVTSSQRLLAGFEPASSMDPGWGHVHGSGVLELVTFGPSESATRAVSRRLRR